MRSTVLQLEGAVFPVIEADPGGGSGYQGLFRNPNVGNVIEVVFYRLESSGLYDGCRKWR